MVLKNKLILIIDDDPLTLKMLDIFFKSKGARVLLEKDCQNALITIDKVKPDITILNIDEFYMRDDESCRIIRERFSRVVSPVIFTSTMPEYEYNDRASYLRGLNYFQKPYSLSNLAERAFKVLGVEETEGTLQTYH